MLPPTMEFLIALAIGGIASTEDWTIAKDAGAYRVNGHRSIHLRWTMAVAWCSTVTTVTNDHKDA